MSEQALFPEPAQPAESAAPEGQRAEPEIADSERQLWPGYRHAPERLAAFCLSTQNVLDKLEQRAGELLQRNGHAADLQGYSVDAARLGLQAAALWNVVLGLRLDIVPAVAPLVEAQPVRSPLQVLQGRIRLTTSETSWDGAPGDQLVIPPSRHGLGAVEDSVVLLAVAKGH